MLFLSLMSEKEHEGSFKTDCQQLIAKHLLFIGATDFFKN